MKINNEESCQDHGLSPSMKASAGKNKYRRFLLFLLIINIIGIFVYGYYLLDSKLPDVLKVEVGTESAFDLELPFVARAHVDDVSVVSIDRQPLSHEELTLDLSSPFSVQLSQSGNYQVQLQFMGITLKKINVEAVDPARVMPVGAPVGIHIKTNGVMVLGTGKITDSTGTSVEPAKGIIKSGDYILEIDGIHVSDISDMTQLVRESQGEPMMLTVLRDNQQIKLQVIPVMEAGGEYKAGIWIRDDTQGIGTLSFVDQNNNFAALGHGITDVDTSLLIDINGGSLYPAQVRSIVKGEDGSPGEMVGTIYYSQNNRLGSIVKNTNSGIFGHLQAANEWRYDDSKALNVGFKQDMHVGKAQIRCCVDGTVKDYEININSIDYNSRQDNKDFVIEITDKELLSKTNGIIQGMSGSPILQDGKIVGVTTHVFLNDCAKGYGIFIENMLAGMKDISTYADTN